LLALLTPANEAIALSTIRSEYAAEAKLDTAQRAERGARERNELARLATVEGRVCFDLFARLVGELLERSDRVRDLVTTRYPFIVLDEFQDTNAEQWRVVQQLGRASTLLALADPEQRIYDWIGADPARLDQFRNAFEHTEVGLEGENHRSGGTDILLFGNEVLTGTFSKKTYAGVEVVRYAANEIEAWTALLAKSYAARRRVATLNRKNWSLAILVPTKRMTRMVSDVFRQPLANLRPIRHAAAVDMEAAILGAEVVAYLLQPVSATFLEGLVELLCNYYTGKGGDSPAKSSLQEAASIRKAFALLVEKQQSGSTPPKNSLVLPLIASCETICAIPRTGDPDQDWRAVRKAMEAGPCRRLKEIAIEVTNLRLLERGTQLRQELSEDWRTHGRYVNALDITRRAFVREHFSSQSRPETGVIVMNMHKAKGKQFDEVIIFEGWPSVAKKQVLANPDLIVRANLHNNIDASTRQNLRVSITRGRSRTLILTPDQDPCVLLFP
jgi:DNA helicase-2/ATP-dependent DNA helicase PcrA